MADDGTTMIRATFETREAADRAVEHLVQQHGIARPAIIVQSASSQNTVGSMPSGGDVNRVEGTRRDAPVENEIEVYARVDARQVPAVRRSLGEVGAITLSER